MRYLVAGGAVVAVALGAWWWLSRPASLSTEERAARFATPLEAPAQGMEVFHIGHSLVGRDMPAMVEQLAHAAGFETHHHRSQLGWGAALRQHWDEGEPIPGFVEENDHPRHADPRAALADGVDALVLTEMVELRDAIRYFDSPAHLANWARLARAKDPDTRVYLYETWHRLDDPDGWLHRLDTDPEALWEGTLLAQAMAQEGVGTVHVIPAGRVMAAVVRALEDRGGVAGMTDRTDLFARGADGAVDPIHLNDAGAYLVALTHVAVLYHIDPRGLPHALRRADGSPAAAVSAEAAALMQAVVADVVSRYRVTGVQTG